MMFVFSCIRRHVRVRVSDSDVMDWCMNRMIIRIPYIITVVYMDILLHASRILGVVMFKRGNGRSSQIRFVPYERTQAFPDVMWYVVNDIPRS